MAVSDYMFTIIAIFYVPIATCMGLLGLIVQLVTHPFSFFTQKARPVAPKCLTEGWTHQYINLPDRNIRLHYVTCGSENKPLMLFLHGFPDFWYGWRHQLKEFQTEYRTVAIDMRGYGDSDKPEGIDNYKMSELTADVKSVVSALGYKKCVLVAHDWGAAVAWQVAASFPEIVVKLIIHNVPHPIAFEKHISSSWKQFLKSWYVFFFQCPKIPELLLTSADFIVFKEPFKCKNPNAFTSEDMECLKYTFAKAGGFTPPLNYYRAKIQRPQKLDRSNKIQPKTLIIWGTNDMALDTEMAEMSAAQCRNARVYLVDGASHFVHVDQPEECNREIWKFLNE